MDTSFLRTAFLATGIIGTISGMRIWGGPVGEKGQRYQETDGLYIREYTNGWAVYNHSGDAQEITLPEEVWAITSELLKHGAHAARP